MPRDTQIFSGADHAGNSDYTLPGNSEIEVLAVNANFKDNGAGADWCPAVVMFSDSGHVIARAMLPDVKVTAGGDAEVSFFPGVKPAAAGGSTTSSGAFALGIESSAQSVASNTSQFSSFGSALTSDSAVLTWSTTTFANDTLTVNAQGVVLCFASALWNVDRPNADINVMTPPGFNALRHNGWLTPQPSLVSVSPGLSNLMDQTWLNNTGGAPVLHVGISNGSAFANGPQSVTFGAILLSGFEAF